MKKSFAVRISRLPIRSRDQKEDWQDLAKIEIGGSVPEDFVGLYMAKAKVFVSLTTMLSTFVDPSFLPEYKLNLSDGSPYLRFTGSHRVAYAKCDVHRVNGAEIQLFWTHLAAVARLHDWLEVAT
ncbi:MAG: hypothetical protein WC250_04020 [Candidatus Paceibacterota bacterium]